MNKNICYIVLLFLLPFNLLDPSKILAIGEIIIHNYSSTKTITARLYPISMVFNGGIPPTASNEYNLKAIFPNDDDPYIYNYINGRGKNLDSFNIPPNQERWFNLDMSSTNPSTWASLSYGRYKIKLYYRCGKLLV